MKNKSFHIFALLLICIGTPLLASEPFADEVDFMALSTGAVENSDTNPFNTAHDISPEVRIKTWLAAAGAYEQKVQETHSDIVKTVLGATYACATLATAYVALKNCSIEPLFRSSMWIKNLCIAGGCAFGTKVSPLTERIARLWHWQEGSKIARDRSTLARELPDNMRYALCSCALASAYGNKQSSIFDHTDLNGLGQHLQNSDAYQSAALMSLAQRAIRSKQPYCTIFDKYITGTWGGGSGLRSWFWRHPVQPETFDLKTLAQKSPLAFQYAHDIDFSRPYSERQ